MYLAARTRCDKKLLFKGYPTPFQKWKNSQFSFRYELVPQKAPTWSHHIFSQIIGCGLPNAPSDSPRPIELMIRPHAQCPKSNFSGKASKNRFFLPRELFLHLSQLVPPLVPRKCDSHLPWPCPCWLMVPYHSPHHPWPLAHFKPPFHFLMNHLESHFLFWLEGPTRGTRFRISIFRTCPDRPERSGPPWPIWHPPLTRLEFSIVPRILFSLPPSSLKRENPNLVLLPRLMLLMSSHWLSAWNYVRY